MLPHPSLQPDQWLVNRIQSTAADPRPHKLEASWYGIHNALLSHYFTYNQRFLIKPQAKIREDCSESISVSSTHAEASFSASSTSISASRPLALVTSTGGMAGTESRNVLIPDFFVVKATEYATHDTPLLVVEVKTEEPSTRREWKVATDQLHEYMGRIAHHHGQAGTRLRLHGLLICGIKVKISSSSPGAQPGDPLVRQDRKEHNITNSRELWKLLRDIAVANWN